MRRITEPFGKAGLMVAVVALVAALVGGAYAANHHRHHKKKGNSTALIKKESKKWSKKFSKQFAEPGPAGPQGPAGANGNDGAAGAKGDTGAQGIQGEPGEPGTAGTAGTDGKSVTVSGTSGCPEGGITVEVEGESSTAQEVCNGEEGLQGPQGAKGEEGSPWVAGAAPKGSVLKGTWSISSNAGAAEETIPFGISTGVPIGTLAGTFVLEKGTVLPGETAQELAAIESACTGSASNPQPYGFAGVVCVYIDEATNVKIHASSAQKAPLDAASGGGELVTQIESNGSGLVKANGTWVFKAPEP